MLNEDIMSMDQYCVENLMATLMTKDTTKTMNHFFQVTDSNYWGNFVATENNKCRIMIGGEFDPLIFRGQNRDYDFISSFNRLSSNFDKCVQWIKHEEFKDFFKKTPFYIRLPQEIGIAGREFEFDLEAIAQHYGFKTNYLDMTKSFNIAMFFAYTDFIDGRFVPINFEKTDYEPHIYVSSIGQLHITSREHFKIVGFQVSPRPLVQCAMALDLTDSGNAKTNFTKIPLPKNNYFSIGVYNSFKKGLDIMPFDVFTEHVDVIKESKIILPELLDKYCKQFDVNRNEIEKELISQDYKIENIPHELTKSQEAEMNFYINETIHPFIANKIGYRRIFMHAN